MRADHRTVTAGLPVSAGRAGARPARMLIVVVAWGSRFTLIMWGVGDAPVLWFAALRALVAATALLVAAVAGWRCWFRAVLPCGR
ncbi:hypothetical protein [Nocardia asiatica]